LLIEDDPGISSSVVRGLKRTGYSVELCTDGARGAARLLDGRFDLVNLDLMLPERDGFEVMAAWRDRTSVPIIVLTARSDLPARLRSFDLGAADWMSKPFFMEELLARIRTRLGAPLERSARQICWADAVLDLDRRVVERRGERVGLTSHEFNLLSTLTQHAGRVLSRRQLGDAALPLNGDRHDRTVNSHIARIRRKLGGAGDAILTVRGVGYCFEPAER